MSYRPDSNPASQAVPAALHEGGLDAQLLRDGIGHLHVVAHQLTAVIVVGPGGPGALHGHHDLSLGLNGGQQIIAHIGGLGLLLAAAGQRGRQQKGSGEGGRKTLPIHDKIPP